MSDLAVDPAAAPEPVLADQGAPAADPAVDVPAPDAGPNWDDPRLTALVDERAAQIVNARLGELRNTPTPAADQPGAPPVNWNEYLDPMGENYGANLVDLLQQNTRAMLEQVREMQAPLLGDHESRRAAANEQALDADITKAWGDPATAGALEDDERTMVKDIARARYPELLRMYGSEEIAADKAVQAATAAVRGITAKGRTAGVADHTGRINALASAPAEPGAGSAGALTLPDGPLNSRALALKFGGKAAALRS